MNVESGEMERESAGLPSDGSPGRFLGRASAKEVKQFVLEMVSAVKVPQLTGRLPRGLFRRRAVLTCFNHSVDVRPRPAMQDGLR